MATTVLGLKTFAASDPVNYNEINDNYTKIDNGVKTAFQGRAAQNLLDNSDFRNPVNQRGITSGATIERYTYFLDRWSTGSTAGAITLDSNGLIFNVLISQKIDPAILRTGTAVTAAAKFSDGTLVIVSGVVNLSTSWHWLSSPVVEGCQIGLVDGTSDGIPYVRIGNENGKTLVWAALYEGSYTADTLPAYQPKGYAAELAECQRYYYQSWDGDKPSSGAKIPGIQIRQAIAASRLANVEFPVAMRIKPTITLYTSDFIEGAVRNWNNSSDTITGIIAVYGSTKGFVPGKEASDFTNGAPYSFHYTASADL